MKITHGGIENCERLSGARMGADVSLWREALAWGDGVAG